VSSYLSSFVEGIDTFTKQDDVLHVSLTQHITSTGRFSGREPNMQNMPRGVRSLLSVSLFHVGLVVRLWKQTLHS